MRDFFQLCIIATNSVGGEIVKKIFKIVARKSAAFLQ
jgi:hypothetical protein